MTTEQASEIISELKAIGMLLSVIMGLLIVISLRQK